MTDEIKVNRNGPIFELQIDRPKANAIDEKSVEPTRPYIKLEPNKNMQVDKLPTTKYLTPASEEFRSSLENETKI